jgi:hypothetical protein
LLLAVEEPSVCLGLRTVQLAVENGDIPDKEVGGGMVFDIGQSW